MGGDVGGKAAIVTGTYRPSVTARPPRSPPWFSLASDEASFITVHILNVDGGFGAAGVIFEPEMIFEPEEAE